MKQPQTNTNLEVVHVAIGLKSDRGPEKGLELMYIGDIYVYISLYIEDGNYYRTLGLYGIMEKKMETTTL